MQRLESKIPIEQFAAAELDRRWKKVLKRGRKLRSLDPNRRHKLRIAVKKIRYASEFFIGAFRGRKANRRRKAFLNKLKPVQDCLGELNGIAVHQHLTAISQQSASVDCTAMVRRPRHSQRGCSLGMSRRVWRAYSPLRSKRSAAARVSNLTGERRVCPVSIEASQAPRTMTERRSVYVQLSSSARLGHGEETLTEIARSCVVSHDDFAKSRSSSQRPSGRRAGHFAPPAAPPSSRPMVAGGFISRAWSFRDSAGNCWLPHKDSSER